MNGRSRFTADGPTGRRLTSVRQTLEDVQVIEAQLEPAVLAPPPQRGREDGVEVMRLESVVLMGLHPGDQVQAHQVQG